MGGGGPYVVLYRLLVNLSMSKMQVNYSYSVCYWQCIQSVQLVRNHYLIALGPHYNSSLYKQCDRLFHLCQQISNCIYSACEFLFLPITGHRINQERITRLLSSFQVITQ